MKQKTTYSLGGLLLAILAAIFYPRGADDPAAGAPPATPPAASAPAVPDAPVAAPTKAAQPAPIAKPAPVAKPKPSPAAKAPPTETAPPKTGPPKTGPPVAAAVPSRVGFTSKASWQSHFEKHGKEFGSITADEYLARAKALRDAALSATVLELVRDDGVITRFDTQSGAFVAFHEDRTIRTFFRPDDGVAYFRRQAAR